MTLTVEEKRSLKNRTIRFLDTIEMKLLDFIDKQKNPKIRSFINRYIAIQIMRLSLRINKIEIKEGS